MECGSSLPHSMLFYLLQQPKENPPRWSVKLSRHNRLRGRGQLGFGYSATGVIIDTVISILALTAIMVKKVNALKARQNLGQLLEEVYYKGDQYVIERAGRPMAAVVPIWQLEARKKRRDRLFSLVEEAWERNKMVKPEAVERDVETAVRTVRSKAARKRT